MKHWHEEITEELDRIQKSLDDHLPDDPPWNDIDKLMKMARELADEALERAERAEP